jgi:talin
MPFQRTQLVGDVIAQIFDSLGVGGKTHGLLQPEDLRIGRNARWLKEDKPLSFYDLQPGDELQLKNLSRQLKFKLLDDTVKRVMIDDSRPVNTVVEVLAEKLGLRSPEEYSLALELPQRLDARGRPLPGPPPFKWLSSAMPLTEQGINPEHDVLVLKKKFYIADDQIDKNDAMQLHLLYIQARDAVINGEHLLTAEEAVESAALICQIMFGDYDPARHTKEFFKTNTAVLLPPPHHSAVERLVPNFQSSWRSLVRMTGDNAKLRYVQLVRGLKTYGITFFEGQFKFGKQKNLTDVRFGILKDGVLIQSVVAPGSDRPGDIIVQHELKHVKRFAAAPGSFTIDFGDYEKDYCVIITDSVTAQAMSELLAGYIDILLKRKKDEGTIVDDDTAEEAMVEMVTALPGLVAHSFTTTDYSGGFGQGANSGYWGAGGMMASYVQGLQGSLGQFGNSAASVMSVDRFISELLRPVNNSALAGLNADNLRQLLLDATQALAQSATAFGDALRAGNKEEADRHARDMLRNMADLIANARLAAAASNGDVSLLDGAKAVSEALGKVLSAGAEFAANPSEENRRRLELALAGLQAASASLTATTVGGITDRATRDLLFSAAKNVAAATRGLLHASAAARGSGAETGQERALDSASQALVTSVSATASSLANNECRGYLESAVRAVGDSSQLLLEASGLWQNVPNAARGDMDAAAKALAQALSLLLQSSKVATSIADEHRAEMIAAAIRLLDASVRARAVAGEGQISLSAAQRDELGSHTQAVSDSTRSLVSAAKLTAQYLPSAADKDALLRMCAAIVLSTRECLLSSQGIVSPDSDGSALSAHRAQLRKAADRLAQAVRSLVGSESARSIAITQLMAHARELSAAVTALCAEDATALPQVSRKPTVARVQASSTEATTAVMALLNAVASRMEAASKGNVSAVAAAEAKLLESAQSCGRPAAVLVAVSRGMVPELADPESKTAVNHRSAEVQEKLRLLLTSTKAVMDSAGLQELDAVLAAIAQLAGDLRAQEALPDSAGGDVGAAVDRFTQAADSLRAALRELGDVAADPVSSDDRRIAAAKAVQRTLAATVTNATTVASMLNASAPAAANEVMAAAVALVEGSESQLAAARALMADSKNSAANIAYAAVSGDTNIALDRLITACSNVQLGSRECDDAIAQLQREARALLTGAPAAAGAAARNPDDMVAELETLLNFVSMMATDVVADAQARNKTLPESVRSLTESMPPVLQLISDLAAMSKDRQRGDAIIVAGHELVGDLCTMISTAKQLAAVADPTARAELSAKLGVDMRTVTEDMKTLMASVSASIVGREDTDRATALLRDALVRLSMTGYGNKSSQEYLRDLAAAAKDLASALGRAVASARTFPERLGPYAVNMADAVGGILDAAKNAARGDPVASLTASLRQLQRDADALESAAADEDNGALARGARSAVVDSTALVEKATRFATAAQNDPATRAFYIESTDAVAQAAVRCAQAARDLSRQAMGADSRLAGGNADLRAATAAFIERLAASADADDSANGSYVQLLGFSSALAGEVDAALLAVRAIAGRPNDSSVQSQLSQAAKRAADALRQLVLSAEDLSLGSRECKAAIEAVQAEIARIDAAAASAAVGLLSQDAEFAGAASQSLQEKVILSSRDLARAATALVMTSRQDVNQFGPSATASAASAADFSKLLKALAASYSESESQQSKLGPGKAVLEAVLTLIQNARDVAGNPKDSAAVSAVTGAAKNLSTAIAGLVASLKGDIVALRGCDDVLALLAVQKQRADALLVDEPAASTGRSYAQADEQLNTHGKRMVAEVNKILATAKSLAQGGAAGEAVVAELRGLVVEVATPLVDALVDVCAAARDADSRAALSGAGSQLLHANYSFAEVLKALLADPRSSGALDACGDEQRDVVKRVADLLAALRSGAVLQREAEKSLARVATAVSELESASLYVAATAGQVDVSVADDVSLETRVAAVNADMAAIRASLGAFRPKTLQQDAASDDFIAQVRAIGDAVAAVPLHAKSVVARLGDLDSQQNVLLAGKACAAAQATLLTQLKGSGDDAETQRKLEEALAAATRAVAGFDDAVRKASEDVVNSDRHIGAACDKIDKALAAKKSGSAVTSTPMQAIVPLRSLAAASGNFLSSTSGGRSAVASAATEVGDSASDMLSLIAGLVKQAPNDEVRRGLEDKATLIGESASAMLGIAMRARDLLDPALQRDMNQHSQRIADEVLALVGFMRQVPGGANVRLEESTASGDLEEQCERELLKAANMIEEAARRLLQARPPRTQHAGVDMNALNAQILEAVRGVTQSTSALVNAASVCQRERIAKKFDAKNKHMYRSDPAWANGLISAAQSVGGTTMDLVTSANGFVQETDGYDEEYLVASAKAVAAATARLMAASRAKSDPMSQSHNGLAGASKGVATATSSLVEISRNVGTAINAAKSGERSAAIAEMSAVQKRKLEAEAMARVRKLEEELQKAHDDVKRLNVGGYVEARRGKK